MVQNVRYGHQYRVFTLVGLRKQSTGVTESATTESGPHEPRIELTSG